MSQCIVPSWDKNQPTTPDTHSLSLPPETKPDATVLDYSVAELTWSKGQLGIHALGPPRLPETLESLVDQATKQPLRPPRLVPWIRPPATVATDAMVPCSVTTHVHSHKTNMSRADSRASKTIESGLKMPRGAVPPWGPSFSCNVDNNKRLIGDKLDDHNLPCHCRRPPRRQRETSGDNDKREEKKKKRGCHESKACGSYRRSRAAADHNKSERKRRDKINQRMKTLQKMVPNSSKTDKASMLEEVIQHIKQLQYHIHVMSTMNMAAPAPTMTMLPPLAMLNPMTMGLGISINQMGRHNMPAALSPPALHPTAFMPMSATDGQPLQPAAMPDYLPAFLACHSQPVNMEAYCRMVAMYQQLQQSSAPNTNS